MYYKQAGKLDDLNPIDQLTQGREYNNKMYYFYIPANITAQGRYVKIEAS